MSLVPEEPLKNACVSGMSVADNIAFREFDRAPFASGGWWLNRAAFRDDADKKIARYKIKTRRPIRDVGPFRRVMSSASCSRASSVTMSKF